MYRPSVPSTKTSAGRTLARHRSPSRAWSQKSGGSQCGVVDPCRRLSRERESSVRTTAASMLLPCTREPLPSLSSSLPPPSSSSSCGCRCAGDGLANEVRHRSSNGRTRLCADEAVGGACVAKSTGFRWRHLATPYPRPPCLLPAQQRPHLRGQGHRGRRRRGVGGDRHRLGSRSRRLLP